MSTTPKAVGAPVGPGSLLWETAGDPRSLLTGTAAGLMQLMLPGLGAGVSDHSNFFDDPYDRIFRSIPYIWGSIFAADDAEGDARGRQIRDFHPDIKGVDHHGETYHALDPDIYWWAHATFTWEFLRARELYWLRPLRRSEQEQLYAETVTWYRRYGVSERPVPLTLTAFEERFEAICRDQLEITPALAWVLDPEANTAPKGAPVRLPGPLGLLNPLVERLGADVLRTIVFGNMPDTVRRKLGFGWSHLDRARFVAICGAIRGLEPAVGRGALGSLFPEGTPHLDPRDHTKVVVAGPNPTRRARNAPSLAGAGDEAERG
jgi:uncharacterized protein (DUF2236 family)